MIDSNAITTLTETKLDALVTSFSLLVDDYSINRQDRNSNGGGVITYIHNSLKPVVQLSIQDDFVKQKLELTVTEVTFPSCKTKAIIIRAYRPPNAKRTWFETFNQLILVLLPMGNLILMGDFNADLLKPMKYPGNALKNSLKLAEGYMYSQSRSY